MRNLLYSDFDDFSSAISDVDCTMLLQNPSRRVWSLTHLDLPGVHIQLGNLGSGNILAGQSHSCGHLLYLPLSDEIECRGNGEILRRGDVWLLEPGVEFHLSTDNQHDWCTVLLPSEKLGFRNAFKKQDANIARPRCKALRPGKRLAYSLESLVLDAITTARNSENFETSFAAERAAQETNNLALRLVGEVPAMMPKKQGRPAAPRRVVLRTCMELLEERNPSRICVNDLAESADVSERSLRNVFLEQFGVTPNRYLQLRRLHVVHRALREADFEETSVTDLLIEYDEWQFGRFAAEYRQLFGEYPSETLYKKKRSH
jgi:AraC family ethanolamine operon transcriptional activator